MRQATAAARSCGVDVLAVLADADGPVPSSRIAAQTGRDRGLTARGIGDLARLGLVDGDPAAGAALSWSLRAQAGRVVEQRLVGRGQTVLDELARGCRESAYLVRREGARSVTLAESLPDLPVHGGSWLGRSQPAIRSDAAPLLLSDLDAASLAAIFAGRGTEPVQPGEPRNLAALERLIAQARIDGHCALVDYVERGTMSIAAGVWDFRERLVGAVVLMGPRDRMRPRATRLTRAVRAAADRLSGELGGRPPAGGGA